MLRIQVFAFSPLQENTYVLYNEHKNAIIIDPGCYFTAEEETLKTFIEEKKLKVVKLIHTHCHFDHIFGTKFLAKQYNLVPFIPKDEEQMLRLGKLSAAKWGLAFDNYEGPVEYIEEGETIFLDEDELFVIAAPGHSPGHVCFYCKKQGFLIGGDVLFYESIGRTDLPMCNHEDLIRNIKEKLFVLPDETIVHSGHGRSTTIDHEKRHNPYIK